MSLLNVIDACSGSASENIVNDSRYRHNCKFSTFIGPDTLVFVLKYLQITRVIVKALPTSTNADDLGPKKKAKI